ncbi:MAG: carboxylesterase [Anaerolineae bacterium]
MAWYDRTLATLEVPYQSQYVMTRYGETHVLTAGCSTHPPLVLLHGTNVSALGWKHQIAQFADDYYVIAPDVIGFAGRSAPVRLPYAGNGYAHWLLDVLDALGVEQTILMGSSGGGYFALKPAILAPERVLGLILINPCGIARFRYPYEMARFSPVMDLAGLIGRGLLATPRMARLLVKEHLAPGMTPDDETVEMAYLLVKYFKRYHPPGPLPLTELRRVTMPVLLLVGAYEPFLHTPSLIRRAQHTFADLRICEVADAGHDIHKDQPEAVHHQIMHFLSELMRI